MLLKTGRILMSHMVSDYWVKVSNSMTVHYLILVKVSHMGGFIVFLLAGPLM